MGRVVAVVFSRAGRGGLFPSVARVYRAASSARQAVYRWLWVCGPQRLRAVVRLLHDRFGLSRARLSGVAAPFALVHELRAEWARVFQLDIDAKNRALRYSHGRTAAHRGPRDAPDAPAPAIKAAAPRALVSIHEAYHAAAARLLISTQKEDGRRAIPKEARPRRPARRQPAPTAATPQKTGQGRPKDGVPLLVKGLLQAGRPQ